MIILDKNIIYTNFFKGIIVITFKKIASSIFKYLWFYN